jgi:type II secretory pathway component GspD/PulD (secretin)
MKLALIFILLVSNCVFAATSTMKLNVVNEDVTKLLQDYSRASGQRFIIDSTVRGKISILNPTEVSLEEAFNQISEALALNGFAIIKNDDVMTVRNARSAQRDNIEVTDILPKAKPNRMITWVINLKYASAMEVQRSLRLLSSSYGEISASISNNQLVVSDWSYNMQRIGEIIKRVDVKQDPSLSKMVAQSKKQLAEDEKKWAEERKNAKMNPPPPPPPKEEN